MQSSPVRARTVLDPGWAGRWKSPRTRLYSGARSAEARPRGRTMWRKRLRQQNVSLIRRPQGSTWCRSRIYPPLAILMLTFTEPWATTGGGLVTAYSDCKSSARFKSEALYTHWTSSLKTTVCLAANCIFHLAELRHEDETLTEMANPWRFDSAPPWPPHRLSHLPQPESHAWTREVWRTVCKSSFLHTIKLHLNKEAKNELVFNLFLQFTFVLVAQSAARNLKMAPSWEVATWEQCGWSLAIRFLGSMGGSVSEADNENTKCPSREQAGQHVKTHGERQQDDVNKDDDDH